MKAAGWLNGLWTLAVACGLLAASCATQLDRQKAPLADPQPPTLHTQSPILQAKLQVTYAHLPLHFEPNQGQTDEQVHFLSRGRGYTLFLTSTEAVLALRQNSEARIQKSESQSPIPHTQPPAVLRLQLVGANPNPRVAGHEALPGQVNYFIGNGPDEWRTNIPTFAKVQYQDVYPGVDLVYYGNQQQLEFDFVVAPGADPKTIRLTFDGLVGAGLVPAQHGDGLVGAGLVPAQDGRPQGSPLQITDNGDLIVSVAGGEVRLRQPLIYQEIDGVKQPISGGYVLLPLPLGEGQGEGAREVGFELASYDTSKPLIIDPVLTYSTYLGGNNGDYATALAPDGSGGVWVAGYTYSTDFPTVGGGSGDPGDGLYDAFVSHFTASGALTFSTYLGGNSTDDAFALAPDGSGGVWVAGYTDSTNFPTAGGGTGDPGGSNFDVFVSHFTASGVLAFSTYLGGNGGDYASALAPDGSGGVWVTGYTASTNFPTAGGGSGDPGDANADAFVSHFTASGVLSYSTYLGGNRDGTAFALAPDGSGGVWMAGGSGDPGDRDAFVSHLTASGGLAYSTYLGGNRDDLAFALAPDGSGGVWVAGYTESTNFPTAGGGTGGPGDANADAFVSHFTASGVLSYSTYLGGNRQDFASALAPDGSGGVWVAGYTYSTNFPTAGGGSGDPGDLYSDAFVSHFTANGALTFSTYLGGNRQDLAFALAPDGSGGVWVAGQTDSTDFPTVHPFQAANAGGSDAFVARISEDAENCTDGKDNDGDGLADCEDPDCSDPDGDGITDPLCGGPDNCPNIFNPSQKDSDKDGVGDICDNCITVKNQDQLDTNHNGIGDACELQTLPEISRVRPFQAPPQFSVTIRGKNFGKTIGTVTFDGVAAPVEKWSDHHLIIQVPSLPPGLYHMQVSTAAGESNAVNFTIGSCVQPLSLSVNNTDTQGLVTGEITEVPVFDGGLTRAKFSIQNDLASLWFGIGKTPMLTPDEDHTVYGSNARDRLLPPDNSADFVASFCKPGTAHITVAFTGEAVFATIINRAFGGKVEEVLTALGLYTDIPAIAKAIKELQKVQSVNPDLKAPLQLAKIYLKVLKELSALITDSSQRTAFWTATKVVAKDVTMSAILDFITFGLADLIETLGAQIVALIQTGGGPLYLTIDLKAEAM